MNSDGTVTETLEYLNLEDSLDTVIIQLQGYQAKYSGYKNLLIDISSNEDGTSTVLMGDRQATPKEIAEYNTYVDECRKNREARERTQYEELKKKFEK